MQLADLPHLNVALNALSAVLLTGGFVAIKRRNITVHKRFMLSALVVTALFLTSYLTYHFGVTLTKKYEGAWGAVYYPILIVHVVGAIVNVPCVIMTVTRALRSQFERHKRVARVTLPLWWFVCVSGVIVYFMLY